MKTLIKPSYLPPIVFLGGIFAACCRAWLFALGKDDRGLWASGSLPDTLSWVSVAAVMAIIALGVLSLKGGNRYAYNFPASPVAAMGSLLAGLSFILTSAVEILVGTDAIGTVSSVLGVLAAIALFYLAYGRTKGLHLSVLFHGMTGVYLMFYLVSHYRLWSSYPQLQSYAFELLAIVFVMLACYHRAAFDADLGRRRGYTFFTLAALFFSIAALPGSENPAFFIGCSVWMLTTPCRLTVLQAQEE